MEEQAQCAPANVLSDLIDGRIVDPDLSDYSSHLEGCSHCQGRVRTLFPSDTLVRSLRNNASIAAVIDEKIPDALIDALKRIPAMDSNANLSRDGLSRDNGMSLDDLGLSFLTPPQKPDEIGRLGHYRVLQVLGRGGMGAVFLAEVSNNTVPSNELELSYGRIELKVHQFSSTGVLTNTETTTWDEAGNVVTATNDFGIANPSLVNNTGNPVISSLDFGTPAGSTIALGKLAYSSIDWAVSNSVNPFNGPAAPAQLGAMTVTLPAAQNAPAPALLGQLARRSELATVDAFEKNNTVPTSALDTFVLSNVYVTGFSVENTGLAETEISFGLDFRSFSEAFTDRTVPATPLITRANFNVQTQASTGVLSFGGKTIDTNFELVLTEAGVTSEIPVQSAEWGVSRPASTSSSGDPSLGIPKQTAFKVDVLRGVHSPGLLAAAVRGTEIDTVSVRRYEIVDVNAEPTRKELYRWDLTRLFITNVGMHMLPGNTIDEVDSISLVSGTVQLVTPNPSVTDPNRTSVAGWNFITRTSLGGGGDSRSSPKMSLRVFRYASGTRCRSASGRMKDPSSNESCRLADPIRSGGSDLPEPVR